jgi:hypothetical protein
MKSARDDLHVKKSPWSFDRARLSYSPKKCKGNNSQFSLNLEELTKEAKATHANHGPRIANYEII